MDELAPDNIFGSSDDAKYERWRSDAQFYDQLPLREKSYLDCEDSALDGSQDELNESDISEEEGQQNQRDRTSASTILVSLILRCAAWLVNFVPSIFHWFKAQFLNSLALRTFMAILWPIASFSAQLGFVLLCVGFAVYIAVDWVIRLPVVGFLVTSSARILWKSICISFGRPSCTDSPLNNWMSSTRLFLNNAILTFTKSFFSPSPTKSVSLFPGHNFTTQFSTIIDETTNLTHLGIDLLPITSVIRQNINSLSMAGSLIQASDMFEKDDLVQGYRKLQNSTDQLWEVMSKYDALVQAIIRNNELNLQSLIRRTNEILSGTDPNTSIATVAFQLSTFFAAASFFTSFLPGSV